MKDDTTFDSQFTGLIKRNERIIFSTCFFYANASVPFDDLRQEVLIALYHAYSSFRNESTESTWVYRVCINTCVMSLKKFTPRISFAPIEAIQHLGAELAENAEFRDKIEWLYEAISRLNPLEKAAILMWLDGINYDEIAANIGIPRNTVASKLHRIKKKLSNYK